MRATIVHRQQDRLLPTTKRHYVDCTILFSEEEKAIIRVRGLGAHYITVAPELPLPAVPLSTIARLLKALAPLVFLGGCAVGTGMAFAGNRGGDGLTAFCAFTALAMFLGGIAINRHVRAAEQPTQMITLARLLSDPAFSIYAIDNARAKVVDAELRETLNRLKEGLLINRDLTPQETFEL